jgi:hypothetical protein
MIWERDIESIGWLEEAEDDNHPFLWVPSIERAVDQRWKEDSFTSMTRSSQEEVSCFSLDVIWMRDNFKWLATLLLFGVYDGFWRYCFIFCLYKRRGSIMSRFCRRRQDLPRFLETSS